MAEERKGAVTMRGNPLTLIGPELKPGDKAPNVTLVGRDMKPVTLDNFKGKVVIDATNPLDMSGGVPPKLIGGLGTVGRRTHSKGFAGSLCRQGLQYRRERTLLQA